MSTCNQIMSTWIILSIYWNLILIQMQSTTACITICTRTQSHTYSVHIHANRKTTIESANINSPSANKCFFSQNQTKPNQTQIKCWPKPIIGNMTSNKFSLKAMRVICHCCCRSRLDSARYDINNFSFGFGFFIPFCI